MPNIENIYVLGVETTHSIPIISVPRLAVALCECQSALQNVDNSKGWVLTWETLGNENSTSTRPFGRAPFGGGHGIGWRHRAP